MGVVEKRWKNSRLGTRGSNKCNLHKRCNNIFYKDGILFVRHGDNILKYPPKGGVVIFNNNFTKVLLVRNNYHPHPKFQKWGLPKGHLKNTEKIHECATRELLEETGLSIKIKNSDKYVRVNNSNYYIYHTDENIINDVNTIDTNEISAVQFHNIVDVNDMNINREATQLLTIKCNIAKKISEPLVLAVQN